MSLDHLASLLYAQDPVPGISWDQLPSGAKDIFVARIDGGLSSVCRDATNKWGQQAQEDVAIGELGELLTMFGRRAQGRDTPEQWIDELVDCRIMIEQLAHLHGYDAFEKRLAEKIVKLRARVDK